MSSAAQRRACANGSRHLEASLTPQDKRRNSPRRLRRVMPAGLGLPFVRRGAFPFCLPPHLPTRCPQESSSTSCGEPRPKGVGWLPRLVAANSIITSPFPLEPFVGTEQTNDTNTLQVGSNTQTSTLPERTELRVVVTRAPLARTMRISILEMGDLKAVLEFRSRFRSGRWATAGPSLRHRHRTWGEFRHQ